MVSVREADVTDADACSKVLCASIIELCTADHNDDEAVIAKWTANKSPEILATWIASPHCTFFVAERDGELAGVGSISDSGEVQLNYVSPDHRYCGVSRALIAHLEATLRAQGISAARLTSTETAHSFYRKAGWTDAGEPENVFGLRGYPMEKSL